MGVLDLVAPVLQLADSLDLPLAHPTDYPHQDPVPTSDGGGGSSPLLIGGGVVATLGLAGGLFWVRERARKAEESAALEGNADAEPDEQRAGPAVEPGDHPRPGQEPA